MNYRFKIYEVSKDGGTGLVCGQAPSLITNFSDIAVTLAVDGVEIHNGELSVGTTNVVVNSITVTLVVTVAGQILIQIPTLNYAETHNVFIKVVKNNNSAHTYEQTLTTYGYDLGNDSTAINDLGLPVTNNPDVDVVLVDNTALDTYTKFAAYVIPLANSFHFVELSSGLGITTYHNNNTNSVINTGDNVLATVLTGEYYSKKYYAENNATCISSNQLLTTWQHCPEVSLDIINPAGQEDQCFISTGKKVRASLNFENSTQLQIDDEATLPFILPQLVYTLRDRLNNIVDTDVRSLNFSDVYSVGYNNTLTEWLLPELDITQDYTLTAEIVSNCQFTCLYSLNIPFCFTEDITHIDCNNYVLANNNEVTVTVSVNKFIDSQFVEQDVYILLEGATQSIELEDGIYQIRFTRGTEFYNRLILADCVVRDCIQNLIHNFVCKSVTIDCNCEDTCTCNLTKYVNDLDLFDVNMINIQYIQYLNLINHLFVLNPLFTTLNDSTEAAIINLDNLLKSFTLYCQNCE